MKAEKGKKDGVFRAPLLDAATVRYLMDPLLLERSDQELPALVLVREAWSKSKKGKREKGVQATFHIKGPDGRTQSFTRHLRQVGGKLYLRGFRRVHTTLTDPNGNPTPGVVEADAEIPRDSARIKALFEVPGAEVPIPPAFLQNLEGRISSV